MENLVYVLMLNDGPIGVTRSEQKAITICQEKMNKSKGRGMMFYHYDEVEDLDTEKE